MNSDITQDKQFRELEKEYRFLSRARGDSLDTLSYVILDIETTGLAPADDEITEIGAIKTRGAELQNIFSSLIKPAKPISAEITKLTGIDNEMVKDAPPPRQVLAGFHAFIGESILVAHNADFDLSFIKYHLKEINGLEIDNSIVCTVKIARYLLPGLPNHKLHTVGAHFGFEIKNRHRAMGDAELAYLIWTKFIGLLKEKGINNKHDLDALASRL